MGVTLAIRSQRAIPMNATSVAVYTKVHPATTGPSGRVPNSTCERKLSPARIIEAITIKDG